MSIDPHPPQHAAHAAPAGPLVLEGRGLTMRFGGLTAVQGVDIHLAAGEGLGIIGPNGAGKSTLLNLLTGIYQPTEGEGLLQGRSEERRVGKEGRSRWSPDH